MSDRVVVVGAGVVGLSCALRLLAAGHRVDVLARDLPLETTSSVAAAIWYPHLALPRDQVTVWGRATYAELARLAGDPTSGVTMRRGTEVLRRSTPEPWWVGAVPALDRVRPPAPYADGWSFVAPVVEMPRYLAWLNARVEEAGGTVTRMALAHLPEGPLVVNCSGLGSRGLAGDESLTPVRGQLTRMIPQSDITYGVSYKDVSFVPRRDGFVFQVVGDSDYYGYGIEATDPNRAEAEHGVTTIASLFPPVPLVEPQRIT